MSAAPVHGPQDAYLEQLYLRAPFGYLITDPHDVIVRVNETFLATGGFVEEELLGRRLRDLLSTGSQLLYETRHLPVLRLQGVAHEVFLQLVAADGSQLPVLVNAVVVPDDSGRPSEVRVGVLDASGRVSYERELLAAQRTAESLAARVSVLQNAAAAFEGGETEAQIAESLASILGEALTAAAACVALVGSAGELRVVAGDNPLDGLVRVDPQLLGATVLRIREAVVVTADDDPDRFPGVVGALREARLRAVAVFPIMSDAKPIGVAAAFFGRERQLSASESDVVVSLTRQASQVLTRMRLQAQLVYAARVDPLTGLANRAIIRETIADILAAAADPLSVMFVDLDGFKAVNDRLGHRVGDAILREVARRLTAAVRATDLVGRYGGDEFVVICAGADGGDASTVAERIHEAIRGGFPDAEGFAISASIGIAVRDATTAVTTDELLGAADSAMYESKRLGRDRTTRAHLPL